MSVVDFICETTEQTYKRAQEKNPDILWSMDAVLAHWQMIRDAHRNGKKVIFFGGPVPIDIIYAMDCVPFYMNMLPTRLSTVSQITGKFIDEAEKYAAPSMCGMNKTEMGILLCDQFGVKPDAFIFGTAVLHCVFNRLYSPIVKQIAPPLLLPHIAVTFYCVCNTFPAETVNVGINCFEFCPCLWMIKRFIVPFSVIFYR